MDTLPPELVALVRAHGAAMCVQRRWRRWHLYAHARRGGAAWARVRVHLGDRMWRCLFPYAHVRREWRVERACWQTTSDAARVLAEARGGEWGYATAWGSVSDSPTARVDAVRGTVWSAPQKFPPCIDARSSPSPPPPLSTYTSRFTPHTVIEVPRAPHHAGVCVL